MTARGPARPLRVAVVNWRDPWHPAAGGAERYAWEVARRLAAAGRAGRLAPADLSGGTFTVSNLGMFGVTHFTAVINPPQAAILAVGAAKPQPVVRDGEVRPGVTMALTLSIDHRVLDGATGAAFLADLKTLLEQPIRIVV